jgi:hypothetical protein
MNVPIHAKPRPIQFIWLFALIDAQAGKTKVPAVSTDNSQVAKALSPDRRSDSEPLRYERATQGIEDGRSSTQAICVGVPAKTAGGERSGAIADSRLFN